jgi:hypothetical protein
MESSLLWRVWEYAWVVLLNWKGGIATACLVVLGLPQLLNPARRAALDATISPERRRKLLLGAVAAFLLIASFQV